MAVSGGLEVVIEEDCRRRWSVIRHFMRGSDQRVAFEFSFERQPSRRLTFGRRVTVRGRAVASLPDALVWGNVSLQQLVTEQSRLEPTRWSSVVEGQRSRVFGVEVDAVDAASALERIIAFCKRRTSSADTIQPALVFTVNLDHAMRLRTDSSFREAYGFADLVLADGFPLVWASRLGGIRLPERVTGSDLIEPICAEAARLGRSIFVFGTTLEILATACKRLTHRYPDLIVAGVFAPSLELSEGHPDSTEAVALINACRPDILFVALGAPKQEIWALRHREQLNTSVVMCLGAGFDYLAGKPRRAPRVLRRLCLEWFWRMVLSPRRYARRYALNLVTLPIMLFEQVFHVDTRRRPRALGGSK